MMHCQRRIKSVVDLRVRGFGRVVVVCEIRMPTTPHTAVNERLLTVSSSNVGTDTSVIIQLLVPVFSMVVSLLAR
jgi:hypothetical protein